MSGARGNVLVMAADYAALEARVTELEQQVRHMLPATINAVSYAVGLVHEDTRAIRETLADQVLTLADHGDMLRTILRRLPPEPES
jgi:hypothetical protein